MNPEDYLDRLIERYEYGMAPVPTNNDEIAASLAAGQALAQLNEIEVPPDFAQRLEVSIRSRARTLARQNGSTLPTTQPVRTLRIPGSLDSSSLSHPRRSRARRTWISALGVAAALVLAFVGILATSTRSLPGDSLYGLKQVEEQFTINFASSAKDRISVQIDQLHSALTDLDTVVNDGRSDDAIGMALKVVADKTTSARAAVAALPVGTDRDTAQGNLDSALIMEDQALRGLLNRVDWPTRLPITQQLGVLGDPVPTMTRVTMLIQSNGTLLITLTGTHFAPGARLVLDGQPAGTVTRTTQGQLVAVLSTITGLHDQYEVGILNPDGTAAQMMYGKDTDHDQQDDNRVRYGTPEPTRTSGSNSGNGDD